MSSRKRPLSELIQVQTSTTPSRYAPSTPHALRAIQERSSAKRSARSARSVNRSFRNGNTTLNLVRPDGSARNILKQFAKITAPVTKKRTSTPVQIDQNKENNNPDGDDDSILTKRPNLTFNIEESIEEEDSEIPVAPTPSALLDDDSDEDSEPPTVTFQNIGAGREVRAMSEHIDRRSSRISLFAAQGEAQDDEEADADADATIMTERGRRALSEEATGRLSRYSFGSIRMSEFGSELEIRRESDRQQKLADLEREHDYINYDQGDAAGFYSDDDDDIQQKMPNSPTDIMDESLHFQGLGDDTFNLQVPDDQLTETVVRADHSNIHPTTAVNQLQQGQHEKLPTSNERPGVDTHLENQSARKQTEMEVAATRSSNMRQKRVKLTRHGTTVPALPSSLVRRIATEVQTKQGKRKPKFGRDHMKALEQATEWFFEQVGEDLAAYSSHGRRKKRIDVGDVMLLMRRQRSVQSNQEIEALAKEWLPKEVFDDLDLSEEE